MLPGSQTYVVSKLVEHRELRGIPGGLRAYARAEFPGDGAQVVRMVREWEKKTAEAQKAARGPGFLRGLVRALESAFASPGWG